MHNYMLYTADVRKENNRYWANFVEIPEAFSEAETKEELYSGLVEALDVHILSLIDLGEAYPEPINDAAAKVEGDFYMTIPMSVDRIIHSKSPKYDRRNVTIPHYLNELAKSRNIEVSKVLREALEKELLHY
ncbi:type II toxin-antitoxin system HicB family antitoxin [Macrococcus capreoli]|uniref:type II toxin-antitoxin system HicB family antitoxin n=1 Tax=Macrococcus capreoli TaxID=2982690 RepID=UPI0021D5887F|nr:type II toxin-antitoxin system HicB family antitoxin [Macrococcus sp. TMW 2.2395]MCU7557443.1 type II toxin-antitoxin system HicB family antitoxin [Macrococcus sp. TMW 2.2395]